MENLMKLANGKKIVYIATRLFDYMEKIKAEKIEQSVIKGLKRSLSKSSIQHSKMSSLTFVPFRDTAQNMIDSPNQTRIIYEQDISRLNRLFMLVSFLDGLSKDEGICMELGYAFGVGVPSIVVVTDFIRRDFKKPFHGKAHLLDPVLEYMVSSLIYCYKIPEERDTFLENLEDGLSQALEQLEQEVYNLTLSKNITSVQQIDTSTQYDVYLDFGGGMFEWERLIQNEIKAALDKKGLSVVVSSRHMPNEKNNSMQIKELGYQDISLLLNSKIIVTCSDSVEMNSGTAALQGLARACNKKIILYDSKSIDIIGDN